MTRLRRQHPLHAPRGQDEIEAPFKETEFTGASAGGRGAGCVLRTAHFGTGIGAGTDGPGNRDQGLETGTGTGP